ncbi:MAG: hypothetical protein IJZ03_08240 [Clostridia bacterium]|nr:hypothetical protein [Clostridia bacterium]
MTQHITGLFPFWDDSLIDRRFTDADLSVNRLEKKELVLTFDSPWEGNCTDFFTVIKDGDLYRMYYEAWSYLDSPLCIKVCYAESTDGIHWDKPSLGICEFNGSTDNNIIISGIPDNFTVMLDTNPSCPQSMRFKALMSYVEGGENTLRCLVSADGIHFEYHSTISKNFAYDTQNTLHYDHRQNKYFCFIREFHDVESSNDPRFNETAIRGIRVFESSDFINWTEPVPLKFMGCEDYPLYTNVVSKYPYDDRYYIGFPSRYVERTSWTKNYDRLCGKEMRLERSKLHPRYGLVVTDCIFMCSTNCYDWYRFDEAIITPGPEKDTNWVYGDCYPSCGGVYSLPSANGEPDDLSIYVFENHWMNVPTTLYRYSCRKDGFASVKAPYKKKTLRTKPFSFEGDELCINFRSSARGGITVRILNEIGNPISGFTSCEIFGDSTDRIIDFDKDISELAGKTVIFEFSMSDAEIYSINFKNKESK